MLQSRKKQFVIGVFSLMLSMVALVGCSGVSDPTYSSASTVKGTLLKAIVLNMGTDSSSVTNAQYDKYFKQGTAAAGVPAVIATGNFFINGYAIPASEADFKSKTPDGYLINQVRWIYYDSTKSAWAGGYKGQSSAATYNAAALAVATGIVAGLEVRLYDTDNDGYTDLIDADFKEGVIVNQITVNSDKSYSVYRGDIDTANKTSYEGRTFDGDHFTTTSGEKIKAVDFDPSITVGSVALFWYGTDGWTMQRAKEVNGIFVDGADHVSYNIDGAVFQDAMRFSRDCLFISNRPGEIANAHKYFGLMNNGEGLKISLWLVPTTNASAQGAPIGLTSNTSAKYFLAEAISRANERLASVTVSVDGKDVSTSKKWVTQAVYTQLDSAITRAKAAMASPTSTASLLDYQIYLLYLTLNGINSDIGAKFGGFTYVGFENSIQSGTKP